MRTPQRLARIAGLLYLIVAVFAAFAFYSRAAVLVPGDAAATARNVVADAGLVRLGVAADLVQATAFLLLVLVLYQLLGHVNRPAARAMVAFVVVAVAMMCLNMVHQYAALVIATRPSSVDGLGPGVADALVLIMLELHGSGFLFAQIFFGLWLLPLGFLAFTSRMFPRWLGVLLVLGCAGYLADTFTRLIAPAPGAVLSPYLVIVPTVAEISMVLWLLVRGVRPLPAMVPAAP
jgi:hypothetical protein